MKLTLLAILLSTSIASADVIVAPKDTTLEKTLEELSRRQHERDMQRRQHELDVERERLRIEAERAATAATASTPPAPAASAAQPQPRVVLSLERTDDLLNGRAWLTWPPEFKAMFIMGIYEGAVSVEAGAALTQTLRTRASYDEIILGLDGMYADPTNRVIPIGRMLPIYTAKTRGTPPSEIDAMTAAALRAIMANAPPATVVPTGQAASQLP